LLRQLARCSRPTCELGKGQRQKGLSAAVWTCPSKSTLLSFFDVSRHDIQSLSWTRLRDIASQRNGAIEIRIQSHGALKVRFDFDSCWLICNTRPAAKSALGALDFRWAGD
jgi:hypothetical protein